MRSNDSNGTGGLLVSLMPRRFGGPHLLKRHNSFSFFQPVNAIRRQIRYRFGFPRRPENFDTVQPIARSQSEMDSQIVLRKIASTAANLIHLNEVSGNGFDAGVESQTIALRSREFEFDPVVLVPTDVAKNHGFAVQIFDDHVDATVVEEIAESRAAAHLRDLNCRSG